MAMTVNGIAVVSVVDIVSPHCPFAVTETISDGVFCFAHISRTIGSALLFGNAAKSLLLVHDPTATRKIVCAV